MSQTSILGADSESFREIERRLEEISLGNELVEQELALSEQKERLKGIVRGGRNIEEKDLDEAVNSFVENRYRFKAPKPSFPISAYVNRNKIAKVVGIPLLATTIAIAGVKEIYNLEMAREKRNAEIEIEQQVKSAYQERTALLQEVDNIFPEIGKLLREESVEQQVKAVHAKEELLELEAFFNQYVDSQGDTSEKVTPLNFEGVEKEIVSVKDKIKNTRTSISALDNLLQKEKEIVLTKHSLEGLLTTIKRNNLPQILSQEAERVYENGLTVLKQKDLPQAKEYEKQLQSIQGKGEALNKLPIELNSRYASIKSIIKEDSAKTVADSYYEEAKKYLQVADIDHSREILKSLEHLEETLNTVYATKIKGGKWRYKNDEPSIKSFYIIVEAEDASGKSIRLPITNRETGKLQTVSQWGELVPESVYEQVKRDKSDNGIIDNNIFSRKERGYVSETIQFKDEKGNLVEKKGEIT